MTTGKHGRSTQTDKGFPFARHGSNYLDLCRNSGQTGVSEAANAFDALNALLNGTTTQVAMEYSLETAGAQHQYLMTASTLTVAEFSGAMIYHREITLEKRIAEVAAPELERRRAEEFGPMQVLETAMPITSQNATKSRRDSLYGLTPFEVDVLQLMAGGLADREIALRLRVTPDVVRWHVGPNPGEDGMHIANRSRSEGYQVGLVDRT